MPLNLAEATDRLQRLGDGLTSLDKEHALLRAEVQRHLDEQKAQSSEQLQVRLTTRQTLPLWLGVLLAAIALVVALLGFHVSGT
jgi:type VI protein secretion system component VasF